MVVVAPPLLARGAPWANLAMLHRIGISRLRLGFAYRVQQLSLDLPEIRRVIGIAIDLWLEIGPGYHDGHMLRRHALKFRERLGIEAKLEHGSGLRLPCQLRIHRLVRPAAKRAWRLDPAQDIGASDSTAVRQSPLGNYGDAPPHGGHGFRNRRGSDLDAVDFDDFKIGLR